MGTRTRAAVAVVAAALVLAGTTAPATAQGWRDGGRITGPHDSLMMNSSIADVVVAVGTTYPSWDQPVTPSTIARRLPDGTWTRVRAHLGETVGVHVNGRGNAVIVSKRSGAVLATTWPRRRSSPVTRVVLRASETSGTSSVTTSVANGRGDVAVLLPGTPGNGDRALLLRKPLGKPWRRALTIDPSRYGGATESIDIRRKGVVVATFRQDQTLSVRNLPPRRDRFGAPTEVTTWPEVDASFSSDVKVMVGLEGDLATRWAYTVPSGGSSQLIRTRLDIRALQRPPWQRDFEHADDYLRLRAVARDGSVLVEDGVRTHRWNPVTRRLEGRGIWFFKDANVRGDALIGAGGRLRLWPVGGRRRPAVSPPAGSLGPVVLTDERRAYVAVSPDSGLPHAFHLRIRRF